MKATILSFKNEDDYRIARDIHVDQLEARGWEPKPDLDMYVQDEDAKGMKEKLRDKGVDFTESTV